MPSRLDLTAPDLHASPLLLSPSACCAEGREPLVLQTQMDNSPQKGLAWSLGRVLTSGWPFLPRKNLVYSPTPPHPRAHWTPDRPYSSAPVRARTLSGASFSIHEMKRWDKIKGSQTVSQGHGVGRSPSPGSASPAPPGSALQIQSPCTHTLTHVYCAHTHTYTVHTYRHVLHVHTLTYCTHTQTSTHRKFSY